MASFSIHLAIGKRYLEKNHNVLNEKKFYCGIIEPDLVDNKNVSHYTDFQNKNDLFDYLAKKVNLIRYLNSEYDASDYQKGVFLHLITDYFFFNNFFEYEYLRNVTYTSFCNDLYYSYGVVTSYLDDKYELDYSDFSEAINADINKSRHQKNIADDIGDNILPIHKLDEFIEYVSDIDLDVYKNKLFSFGNNICP